MGKSKKGGLLSRQRRALERLEKIYEAFKAAGKDKLSWETSRRGRIHMHHGHKYEDECARMKQEIENIKKNMTKHIK